MTRRRTYHFPNSLVDAIEKEATRRIEEEGYAGLQLGRVSKELLIGCYMLAWRKVKKLPKKELAELVKKCR